VLSRQPNWPLSPWPLTPRFRRCSSRTPARSSCPTVAAEDYRAILLYAGDEVPLDGLEELIVALYDIAEVLSRPTLARLAKIGRIAQQVASAGADPSIP
jgi:hypothetical protein